MSMKASLGMIVFRLSCGATTLFAQSLALPEENACTISCPDGSAFPGKGATVACDDRHSPFCQCEDGDRRMAGCEPRGNAQPSESIEWSRQHTFPEGARLVLRVESSSREEVLFSGYYLGDETGLVRLVDQSTPFEVFLDGSFISAVFQSPANEQELMVQVSRETAESERTLIAGQGALHIINTDSTGNHSIRVMGLPN